MPEQILQDDMIIGAVCNGKQAGGGQQLAPSALIDDGLVDIVALHRFPTEQLRQVINEIKWPEASGDYVKRFSVP